MIRADNSTIIIGENSNIQDQAIIVTNVKRLSDHPYEVQIGNFVTIGHGAMLTSCVIGNNVLVGQGAILQEGNYNLFVLLLSSFFPDLFEYFFSPCSYF